MATTYFRKIKCPRHYLLKPGGHPFVMEPIPEFRYINKFDLKRAGIHTLRRKRDKFGRFIQNWADYINPEMLASEIRQKVFDPTNSICMSCKRCVTA